MTIGDWLDIFIFRKEFSDDFTEFSLLNNNQKQLINENVVRIDKILLTIYENDKIYFYCFMLIIYNYRRFFMLKDGRASNKKNKKIVK